MHMRVSSRMFNRVPLLLLLDPRERLATILSIIVLGGLLAANVVLKFGIPLWQASFGVLVGLLFPAALKWREDARLFGDVAMVLCILVALQGFHTIEHIVQWAQYHILRWPSFRSSGLLSAFNSEWVHFVWNWGFLLICIWLFARGMRGPWAVLLLVWASAHTFEHTYMMWRYQQTLQELSLLNTVGISAQGLPGILGRDGWLATADATQNTFLCRIPGLTTAVRIDVHFWWNVGEIMLLLPAANAYMSKIVRTPARAEATTTERVDQTATAAHGN